MANEFEVGDKVVVEGWEGVGYVQGVPHGEERLLNIMYPPCFEYWVRFPNGRECMAVKPEYVHKA